MFPSLVCKPTEMSSSSRKALTTGSYRAPEGGNPFKDDVKESKDAIEEDARDATQATKARKPRKKTTAKRVEGQLTKQSAVLCSGLEGLIKEIQMLRNETKKQHELILDQSRKIVQLTAEAKINSEKTDTIHRSLTAVFDIEKSLQEKQRETARMQREATPREEFNTPRRGGDADHARLVQGGGGNGGGGVERSPEFQPGQMKPLGVDSNLRIPIVLFDSPHPIRLVSKSNNTTPICRPDQLPKGTIVRGVKDDRWYEASANTAGSFWALRKTDDLELKYGSRPRLALRVRDEEGNVRDIPCLHLPG